MFHFNTMTRTECYEHGFLDFNVGYDGCYDCTAELDVLYRYTQSIHYKGGNLSRQDPLQHVQGKEAKNDPPEEGELSDSALVSESDSPMQDRPPENEDAVPGSEAEDESGLDQLNATQRVEILGLGQEISDFLGWRALFTPQPPPGHRRFLNRDLRFGQGGIQQESQES